MMAMEEEPINDMGPKHTTFFFRGSNSDPLEISLALDHLLPPTILLGHQQSHIYRAYPSLSLRQNQIASPPEPFPQG